MNRNQGLFLGTLLLIVSLAPVALLQGAPAGPYHYLATIKVGGEGGWDYGAVDSAGRRLYYSHTTKVVVIDIDKNEVVGEIAATPGVHGIAIAPELGLVFTSNGQEDKAGIVDLKTLTTKMKVDTGQTPTRSFMTPARKKCIRSTAAATMRRFSRPGPAR